MPKATYNKDNKSIDEKIENSNDCFCGAQMGILSMQASLIEEIVELLNCRHNREWRHSASDNGATRS